MKTLLMIATFLFVSSAFAENKKQNVLVKKEFKLTQDQKKTTTEAPCADDKEAVLKKLEEEKKKQEKLGKGLSLQGGNTEGCTIN